MKKTCHKCKNDFIPKRYNQKFCTVECRTIYHNNIARGIRHKTNYYSSGLLNNRKILCELYENEGDKVYSKDYLLGAGYVFKLLTHTLSDANNVVHNFCFDYALADLGKNSYKIVHHEYRPV